MNVSRRLATTFFAFFAAAAIASSLPSFAQSAQASVAFDGDSWTVTPGVTVQQPGGDPGTTTGGPWTEN
ncbi:hypothetical protein [Nonomuraea gerenzanensis]|uniref:Uncharacterized protein n=1 Tax=Nonomuraea gerenzanensis TaxID=93944 RepID=A0A1M4BL27_9ACTN|nr:hypothetical protein [Nonomuraea gerenzanensis]UBU19220.1 hypothetical protein LCN96_56215 [Nonomuraea gerenzanensis]SAP16380.1 hypothetical protein BN4615_P11043 [Nonomuraea gerenzanensis]